jgi:biotin carboxylase
MAKPLNMLMLASYYKGDRFMRQAAARGAKCYLLTQEKLLGKAWPRECLTDVFAQKDGADLQQTINTVSYLARTINFDRIVALDDFDVETAATLREHMRIAGMGDTTARHFRDKLAMRMKAQEAGIPVPPFVRVLNHEEVKEFIAKVPPPWMFKPRSEASATGITKVESEAQLWEVIHSKGDRQSYYVLEKYLPGDVYHADALTWEKKQVFAGYHRCGTPPFNVAHGGGIFTTFTVDRGSEDERALKEINEKVLSAFGLVRGASHVEFIKNRNDGKFYLLEAAARVGGAHIADVLEASSGVNLWAEWANIEISAALKENYTVKPAREEYAGIALTLAKSEQPDLTTFNDPEIVFRTHEPHHVGLIVRSKSSERVKQLLNGYQERFLREFSASMPAPEKSLH